MPQSYNGKKCGKTQGGQKKKGAKFQLITDIAKAYQTVEKYHTTQRAAPTQDIQGNEQDKHKELPVFSKIKITKQPDDHQRQRHTEKYWKIFQGLEFRQGIRLK